MAMRLSVWAAVGFSIMSLRFFGRAAAGIAGAEVERGGEMADAADFAETAAGEGDE